MKRTILILLVSLAVLMTALPASAGAFGKAKAGQWWQMGLTEFKSGNPAGAITYWTDSSVVKYYADDPGYYYLLGSAYAHVGNGDKALECAQKGLALHPKDNNLVGNLQWVRGRAYLTLKQYDAAIAAAQSAIAAQPQDFNNYLLLAQADFSEKRYDQAITAAKRSVEIKPSPNGYLIAAAAFWKKNDPDTALRVARKGLALAPQNPDLLMLVGRLNTEKLDFDASLEAYSKAEAVHANESAESVQYALYFGGKYDEAFSRCQKYVQDAQEGRIGITVTVAPNAPPIVASVLPNSPASEAGLRKGDWIFEIDGQKTCKGAFHLTPVMTAEEIITKLKGPPGSSVTLKIWHPEKILRFNRTLVRKTLAFDDEANYYALESLCYFEKKDAEHALAAAQEAVKLKPGEFWPELALGFALLQEKRYDDALKAFDTKTTSPTSSLLYTVAHLQTGRALCYAGKGDLKKAADIFTAAAGNNDPRYVPGWEQRFALLTVLAPLAKSHTDKAKQLEAEGRYAESLPEYTRALQLAATDGDAAGLRAALFSAASKMPTPPELPESARVRVVRGEALMKDGDLKSAVPEFNDAIQLAPYMPKLYYNAAILNGKLKRYSEAIRLMNIYIQGAPDAPDVRAAKDQIIRWDLEKERLKANAPQF